MRTIPTHIQWNKRNVINSHHMKKKSEKSKNTVGGNGNGFKMCPKRSDQELSSGALRDEVDGDKLPEGGTGDGIKLCPKRSNQELSSGALKDEVDGDNLLDGGTRNGIRMCTKESYQKTQKMCPSPPSESMNRDVTECESRIQKCKNLSQAKKFSIFGLWY